MRVSRKDGMASTAGILLALMIPLAGMAQTQVSAASEDSSTRPDSGAVSNRVVIGSKVDAALPTAKELLLKAVNATGGADAWKNVTSRYMKGLYQSEDASTFTSIEIFQKSPNKSLYRIKFPNDMVVRDVCDGQSAWLEDPRGGYYAYTGAALESRVKRAQVSNQAEAFLLEVTGKVTGVQTYNGRQVYVVTFTPEKNDNSVLFFDVDTGLVVHTEDTMTTPNGPYVVKMDLDDYRDVDGLKYAFRLKRIEKGAVTYIRLTQIKNNAPIDDSMFLKPETAPK